MKVSNYSNTCNTLLLFDAIFDDFCFFWRQSMQLKDEAGTLGAL